MEHVKVKDDGLEKTVFMYLSVAWVMSIVAVLLEIEITVTNMVLMTGIAFAYPAARTFKTYGSVATSIILVCAVIVQAVAIFLTQHLVKWLGW